MEDEMTNFNFSVASHFLVDEIKSDTNGGPISGKQELIGNQADFDTFFDGAPPSVTLDFSRGFIFAVALGQRPTTGYSVKIRDITLETDGFMAGTVTVSYEEVVPSGPAGDMITTPYTAVRAVGLDFATNVVFRKVVGSKGANQQFIVIALTGTNTGCRILQEGEFYPAIFSQVFGAASLAACKAWVATNCQVVGQ